MISVSALRKIISEAIVGDTLGQACQTQITVRAAQWILELEKLTEGRSLEKHATLSQF